MLEQLKNQVIEAFAEVQSEMETEVNRVIEATDEFPGFDGQDIVDTGRLRDSLIVDSTSMKLLLYWTATSPENDFYYPAAIIMGFFAFGVKWIPGRDYPVKATRNVMPVESLVNKLRDRGLDARIIEDNTNLL